MKTIIRYILVVTVAISVSWGLAPNEVCAIAGPCELLAALEDEEELRRRLDSANQNLNGLERRLGELLSAMEELQAKLDVPLYHPKLLEVLAETQRSLGNEREAQRLEAAARELLPIYEEKFELEAEYTEALEEWTILRERLRELPGRRAELEEECGGIKEMSDLISSFEHRVPSSVPSDPQMQNPMGSPAEQASNETQYVIPFGVLQEGQPPQAATCQMAMPETQTATVKSAKARLFNKLPESSAAGASQSTPAATGQVMHVDQSENSNTGTSSFGYTHMPLNQNSGQFGQSVAPQKTLRGIVRVRQLRFQPGRSINR